MILNVIMALCCLESGDDCTAVGDNGRAVGVLQMHKIMVDEVNRISGRRFTYEDRKDGFKSVQMASIFLGYQRARFRKKYGSEPTPVELGSSWNTGDILKVANNNYIKKLELILDGKELSQEVKPDRRSPYAGDDRD